MSDFRIPYGLSLGRYGNFQARTDGLLGNTDTTPDVSDGSLFYADVGNTASITYFDGRLSGGVNGVEEGKLIKVLFLGTGTTLVNSAVLNLEGDINYEPETGSSIELLHHASAWYELTRASLAPQTITVTSSNLGAAAATRLTITPETKVVLALAAASSLMSVHAMPGGVDGQRVTIVSIGSQVTLTAGSVGLADTFMAGSATSYVVNGSFAVTAVRATMGGTAVWFLDAPHIS